MGLSIFQKGDALAWSLLAEEDLEDRRRVIQRLGAEVCLGCCKKAGTCDCAEVDVPHRAARVIKAQLEEIERLKGYAKHIAAPCKSCGKALDCRVSISGPSYCDDCV